jgi:transcriptional regulator with XRE-family HTH domain
MNADLIDHHAIHRLREICKLDRARAARLSGLTEAQIIDLESGGYSQFPSREMKVQAALKFGVALSGAQPNGMPVVNVFRPHAAENLGITLPPVKFEKAPQPKQPFPDSPEFYKLLLIFVVMVFLLVAVAMPLLFSLPSPPPKFS